MKTKNKQFGTVAKEGEETTTDLFQKLATSEMGLSPAEAEKRLSQYGYNELPEEKTNALVKFLSYFWGPIPWMIEAAAVLSAMVGDWTDFGIIMTLLLGNALVGFWEEYQAGNAIAALKANLALQARGRRDGAWTMVPARAFWSIRPAPVLFTAVVGTQVLATLIAVYGVFMSPIGWK